MKKASPPGIQDMMLALDSSDRMSISCCGNVMPLPGVDEEVGLVFVGLLVAATAAANVSVLLVTDVIRWSWLAIRGRFASGGPSPMSESPLPETDIVGGVAESDSEPQAAKCSDPTALIIAAGK